MKKKLLPMLLALVCALCFACLAACGMVAVESVTLDETTLTLKIDDVKTLTATVTPEDATDKAVVWSSSAPAVASVDEEGKVTAKAEGTATITATAPNGKTATCTVTVEPKTYQRMTKAEWEAAFDATLAARNFTYSWNGYSGSAISGPSGDWKPSREDYEEHIDQIMLDDVNGRIYNGGENDYFVVEDGVVYYIDGRIGMTSKEDASEEFEDGKALFDYFAIGLYQEELLGDVFRELYDAIVSFDEITNAYVVSVEGADIETHSTEMTLIFADGKFSRMEVVEKVYDFELIYWITYSDYGTTVVTLPE